MRKFLIFGWLALLVAVVCALFWYNEYRYSLPTPIPQHYQAVANGKLISLKGKLNFTDRKPVFLHFFNPDCPCSRFNIAHFKTIVDAYAGKADFAIVVVSNQPFNEADIRKKFDLHIPIIHDPALAIFCGVYSTPQAAILDQDRRLFYRGNYNRSRYCTDGKTEYAKQALDDIIHNRANSSSTLMATTSYGCSLAE